MPGKIEHKIIKGIEYKRCSGCKQWLPLDGFYKAKNRSDGLDSRCKNCQKKYYFDNIEHKKHYNKKYRSKNKEHAKQYNKQYQIDNAEKIKKQKRKYYINTFDKYKEQRRQYNINNYDRFKQRNKQYQINNKVKLKKQQKKYYKDNIKQIKQQGNRYALYLTYNNKIKLYEKTRKCPQNNELLEIKCSYCGCWLKPTNKQVQNRIQSFNGATEGENRFYCSENCKQTCPIYHQQKYPKNFKHATSREVVPLLRQLVLARDNYECQKCGATTETAQLHVHHVIPYAQNKMQANDPDSCITFCKKCHKGVHQQDGCKYSDLKCKKET